MIVIVLFLGLITALIYFGWLKNQPGLDEKWYLRGMEAFCKGYGFLLALLILAPLSNNGRQITPEDLPILILLSLCCYVSYILVRIVNVRVTLENMFLSVGIPTIVLVSISALILNSL